MHWRGLEDFTSIHAYRVIGALVVTSYRRLLSRTTLASGGEDHNVHLWDLSTGQSFKVLEGHHSSVWSVTFGNAGKSVASASDDGTTRLWNRQTWECIKILRNDKPYDGMNITGIIGVTEVQKTTFKTLGAYEEAENTIMTG